jgi:molecular chaperone DnaJ
LDFYIILGVSPDASTADIKRAYRRLARRYHPGINPGDRAAESMFQRITEAYDTLVDAGRRRQYDAGGRPVAPPQPNPSSLLFTEFDFSVTARGAQAATFSELFADILHPMTASGTGGMEVGADLHAELTVTFAEAVHGVTRQVVVTRQVSCGACRGAGLVATAEGMCERCRGTGQVRWARGHMVFAKSCSVCGGNGRRTSQPCPACTGHGLTVRSEGVDVTVPSGLTDAARLRVPEKGHAGRHGGRHGDLYVTVHVQPHPLFRREGDDLVSVLPVAVHEAVLGARVDVPSLEGTLKLRIPPGTRAGDRLHVEGRGCATPAGGRGDLVFEVRLVLPENLNEQSKALMREFARLHSGDVRKDLQA